MWSANRYEWVVMQYSTARIGAILVNINPAYKTSELEYALKQCEVSLLILARSFRQSDYVGQLGQVKPNCPDLRDTLVLEDDWSALLESGALVDPAELDTRESTLQFDDPINI